MEGTAGRDMDAEEEGCFGLLYLMADQQGCTDIGGGESERQLGRVQTERLTNWHKLGLHRFFH